MNTLLSETKQLFSGLDAAWAVCGGFALDLFLGRETRPHGDIDLCAFEEGRGTIQAYMHGLGWRVYEFRGMGRVRLLTPDTPGEAGRNLMCVRDGCELVDFYPSDVEGLLWHVFHHVGIHKLNYLEFLFNESENGSFVFDREKGISRPMSEAILFREDVPFLCPELALLYKSAYAEEEKNKSDFREVLPAMNDGRRAWLWESLAALHGEGHPWLDEL